MNASSNMQEQLERIIETSETITLRAVFELLAGQDHDEVFKRLAAAHEVLWNDMVREGNQDLLLPILERMLSERSTNE